MALYFMLGHLLVGATVDVPQDVVCRDGAVSRNGGDGILARGAAVSVTKSILQGNARAAISVIDSEAVLDANVMPPGRKGLAVGRGSVVSSTV